MPLKHRTETRLVILLGFAILATGFALSILPGLPAGVVPWSILFVLTVLYPAILYPLFKRDRADHTFRLLHWFPAVMSLVWMAAEILTTYVPNLGFVQSIVSAGWMLPLILIGILWLAIFCFRVIRQSSKRITALALMLIPFAVLALWSDSGPRLDKQLSAKLFEGEIIGELAQSGSVLIGQIQDVFSLSSSSEPNEVKVLDPSADKDEERWRQFLRDMEKRDDVVVSLDNSSSSSESMIASVSSVSNSSMPSSLRPGGDGAHLREVDSNPDVLPHSGFSWAFVLVTMLAGYCSVLHKRQKLFV